MKNGFTLLVLAALLVGAFYVASPIWALSGLRTAIEEGDAVELEDRVDFPSVRESLKAEINAQVMADVAPEVSGSPFGVLAMGIASTVLDAFVEAAVTPTGLARIARGDSAPVSSPGKNRRPRNPDSEEDDEALFRDARLERETLSRFSVWVPDENDDEIRFVFRRSGLAWRLTSIELPRGEEAAAREDRR